MRKIAVITARSGSKGLKDKNILDLAGKPLIAWTIEAAIESAQFERIIVSTDSPTYKAISEKFGAEVIMRDKELASDSASSFDVLKNLLEKHIKIDFDYFVLLQPTSPLRNGKHIREACSAFETKFDEYNFSASVSKSKYSNDLIKTIEGDLSMKNFDADFSDYKRQSFDFYHPNGAIFMAKPSEYLKQKHFFGRKSLAYIMNEEDSVDIDSVIDLELARLLIYKMNNNHA